MQASNTGIDRVESDKFGDLGLIHLCSVTPFHVRWLAAPKAVVGSHPNLALIVIFRCNDSMLAASSSRSNVSPKHLKMTPVLAFTSIAAKQLGKLLAVATFKAQPGKVLQHHTTRLQGTRQPLKIAIKHRDFST
jgi:hypothetical protein